MRYSGHFICKKRMDCDPAKEDAEVEVKAEVDIVILRVDDDILYSISVESHLDLEKIASVAAATAPSISGNRRFFRTRDNREFERRITAERCESCWHCA